MAASHNLPKWGLFSGAKVPFNTTDANYDPIITSVILSRLDTRTLAEWEKKASQTEPPNRKQLLDFLVRQERIMESVESTSHKPEVSNPKPFSNSR